MSSATTKDVPFDITKLSLDQVDALIEQARQYKRSRQTNPVLVKGYVESVDKHVTGCLVALAKMLKAEGVAKVRWQEVERHLSRLQLEGDRYKEEARKIEIKQKRAVK